MQVLFDHNGCIKKYSHAGDILREFFDVRLDYYERRKQYLEGMLGAESLKLDNIARFILEKIEGKVVIGESVALKWIFGVFFLLKERVSDCIFTAVPLINVDAVPRWGYNYMLCTSIVTFPVQILW